MNYAPETFRRAFKIYQEKHGGSLTEISILFVNVTEAIDEAAQHGVQRTADRVPLDDYAVEVKEDEERRLR